MSSAPLTLRFFLDASVPDAVGEALVSKGYTVIQHRDVLADKTADEVVCAAALANDAILVASDGDMKQIAKRYGVAPKGDRFKSLSIIRLCCNETLAAARIEQAISLIEHEWTFSEGKAARRMWIDIAAHHIRTNR